MSLYSFNPYKQETRCTVANNSLFSYLCGNVNPGSSSELFRRNPSEMEESLYVPHLDNDSYSIKTKSVAFGAPGYILHERSAVRALEQQEQAASPSEWIPGVIPSGEIIPPVFVEPESTLEPSHVCDSSIKKPFPKNENSATPEDPLLGSKENIDICTEGSIEEIPFRKRLEEVRQRVKEQLLVHQELETALHQIERIEEEANIFRCAHAVGSFMSSIGGRIMKKGQEEEGVLDLIPHSLDAASIISDNIQWLFEADNEALSPVGYAQPYGVSLPKEKKIIVPFDKKISPEERGGNLATPPAKSFLAEVLERFRKKEPLTAEIPKTVNVATARLPPYSPTKHPVEICRPDPAPVPYRRVVYVLDSPTVLSKSNGGEKSEKESFSSLPVEVGSFSPVEDATTAHAREESFSSKYTEDFTDPRSSLSFISISSESLRAASVVGAKVEEDYHSIGSSESVVPSSSSPSTEVNSLLGKKASSKTESGSVKTLNTEIRSSDSIKTDESRSFVRKDQTNEEIIDELDGAEVFSMEENPLEIPQTKERTSSTPASPGLVKETFDEFLTNFQKTCQQANELAFSLAQTGIRGISWHPPGKKSEDVSSEGQMLQSFRFSALPGNTSSTLPAKALEPSDRSLKNTSPAYFSENWVTSMIKDLHDVAKLKHFTKRLEKNLKSMDTQRKVRGTKKKLLEKAQKLSRTREQLKKNPKARIRDIISPSEIEDLLKFEEEDYAQKDNQGIEDEIESIDEFSQMSESKRSSEESIADELSFSNDMRNSSISGEIEDEVENGWDNDLDLRGSRHDDRGIDIADDSISMEELSENLLLKSGPHDDLLDEIEENFADRLVMASSLSDLMDDLPLPSIESSRASSGASVPDSLELVDNAEGNEKSVSSFATNELAGSDRSIDNPLESSISDEVDSQVGKRRSVEKKSRTAKESEKKHSPSSSTKESIESKSQEIFSSEDSSGESSDFSMSDSSSTNVDSNSLKSTAISYSSSQSSNRAHSTLKKENSSWSSSTDKLAEDWAQTKDRRRKALHKVRGSLPTFTQLYDPRVSSTEFSLSSTSSVSSFSSFSSLS